MANVLGTLFQNIADAIRSKTGGTDTMKPSDFPEHIKNISIGTGGEEMAIELIWENPEPTSDFASQTLQFEKEYKYFVIEYFTSSGTGNSGETPITVETLPVTNKSVTIRGFSCEIEEYSPAKTTLKLYMRGLTVKSNSIYFGSAQSFSFGNTQEVEFTGAIDGCIPYRIWGFS